MVLRRTWHHTKHHPILSISIKFNLCILQSTPYNIYLQFLLEQMPYSFPPKIAFYHVADPPTVFRVNAILIDSQRWQSEPETPYKFTWSASGWRSIAKIRRKSLPGLSLRKMRVTFQGQFLLCSFSRENIGQIADSPRRTFFPATIPSEGKKLKCTRDKPNLFHFPYWYIISRRSHTCGWPQWLW